MGVVCVTASTVRGMARLGTFLYCAGLGVLGAAGVSSWWSATTPPHERTLTEMVTLTLRDVTPESIPDESVTLLGSLLALKGEFVRLVRDLTFTFDGRLDVDVTLGLILVASGLAVSRSRWTLLRRGLVAAAWVTLLLLTLSWSLGWALHLVHAERGAALLSFWDRNRLLLAASLLGVLSPLVRSRLRLRRRRLARDVARDEARALKP